MSIKRILPTVLMVLLLGGVTASQYFIDRQKAKAKYFEPIVLDSEMVKAINLGLDNATADLMWLAAIQYFGDGKSRTYEKIDDYLFLSSNLDSRFAYPYAFGVLVMPSVNQTDKGIELALKGVKESPNDWRIPYYLATTYHIEKNDREKALKYFDIAARTPGAPENIKVVAANYGSKPDLREQTKQIWIGIYETSNDEVVREQAKKYITHYEILDLLENAANIYKNRYQAYPETLQALVTNKILTALPPDPFGLNFKIDKETGRVLATLEAN